ncbi:MAG: hypothetical protein J6P73_05460, partial [Bacteroidales bacterium]|nr:hypothetical protein [Bacteroidales bacterium]
MKTANYKLLTITLFALLLMGCHKDSQVETITPVVTENGITKNNNQFTFNWTVDYPGLIRSLVLISDNESVEGAISYGSDMLTDDKNFSATTNNLTFSDTYYYCYLVWNDYGSYRTEAKELVPTPT